MINKINFYNRLTKNVFFFNDNGCDWLITIEEKEEKNLLLDISKKN